MLTKTVSLLRGDAGFGFSVIGGSDTYLPPMVFTIAPHKPAQLSNQIEKGDRILSVNGTTVSNISSKQVIQLINEAGNTMQLALQDDPDLKKRLNAFMQAKARSASPAPELTAAAPKAAPTTPVKSVVSPSTGRTLYQPSYARLNSDTSRDGRDSSPRQPDSLQRQHEPPQRHPEPPQRHPEPPQRHPDPVRHPEPARHPEPPKSYNAPRTMSNSAEKYLVPNEDHVYNDLDSTRNNTGVRQTSLSFLSDEHDAPSRTYSGGVRENDTAMFDSRNETAIFDVNPAFVPSTNVPPDVVDNLEDSNVPVYAQVNKKKSNTPLDERPFSGLKQVYHPPPQYEAEPPLPPELPPDIPPRETAESCARRLFYQEGCVPEDVSFTLASTVPFDEDVSYHYMLHFNFDNYKLDDAVRVFVERAPLIGENSSRERILYHLSKHLYETNTALRQQLQGPEEIHTLVCALMMLNTDLHGGMVDKKMTYNQFENNLRNTTAPIDKGVLKELYNGIKAKPIIFSKQQQQHESAKPLPTLEQYEHVIHKQGPLTKKNVRLASGKRPGIFKRGWKRLDVELRGSKLTFSKSGKREELICHHCLASRADAHKTRHSVMRIACADDRVLLLQARDDMDMQEWVHAINKVAAMFSALPMAAPVSNSNNFQPHSLPMSRTKCTLEQQLHNHMIQVDKLSQEYDTLIRQQSNQVTPSPDFHYKKVYLEREKEKFEEYAHLLNALLFPDSEESLMSPQSFGRATANRMSYKRAVQKNVKPVEV